MKIAKYVLYGLAIAFFVICGIWVGFLLWAKSVSYSGLVVTQSLCLRHAILTAIYGVAALFVARCLAYVARVRAAKENPISRSP